MKTWVKLGGGRTRRQSPASCNKAASSGGCFSLSAPRGFRSDTIPRIFFREAPYPAVPNSCVSPAHDDSASAESKQNAPPCSAAPDDSRSSNCTCADQDHDAVAVTAAATNQRGTVIHAPETCNSQAQLQPESNPSSGNSRPCPPDHAATATNSDTEASETPASENPDPESGSGRRGATREAASSRRRHGSPDVSQICPISSSPVRVAGARHRHVTPRRGGSGSLNSLSKEFDPPAVVFSAISAHPFSSGAGASPVAAGRSPVAAGLTRLIHDLYGGDDGSDSDGGGNVRFHSEGDLYGPVVLPANRGKLGSVDDFSPDYHNPPHGTTFRSGPLPPTASASRGRSPAGYFPVKTASESSLHADGGYYPTLAESPVSTRHHLTKSPFRSRPQFMQSPQSMRHHLTGSPLSSRHHPTGSPLSRNATLDSHEIAQRRSRRTLSQPPDFPGFEQDLGGVGAICGGGSGNTKRVVFVERMDSDSPLRVHTQQPAFSDHDGFASPLSFASPFRGFNSPGESRPAACSSGDSNGGRGGGSGGNGADGCGMSKRSMTQPKTRVPASLSIGPCTSLVTGGSCRAATDCGQTTYQYPGGATPGRCHSSRCHLGGGSLHEHRRSEDHQMSPGLFQGPLKGDCHDGGSGIGRGHSGQRQHISGGGSGGGGGCGGGGGGGRSEGGSCSGRGSGIGSEHGGSEDNSYGDSRHAGPATAAAAAAVSGARHRRHLSRGSGAYSYAERREESRSVSEADDFSRDASKLFGCGGSETPPRRGLTLAAGSTSPYHTSRGVSRSATSRGGTTTTMTTSINGGSPHSRGVDRATQGSPLVAPHAGVDRVDRLDLFQHYQHNRNPSAWSSPYLAQSGLDQSATFCGAGPRQRPTANDQRPEVCRSPTPNERAPKERISRDCGAGTQGPRKLGPTYAMGGSLGGAFGGSPIVHHRRQHSTSSSGVFSYSIERYSSHHVTYVSSFERHIQSVAEAERLDRLAILSSG